MSRRRYDPTEFAPIPMPGDQGLELPDPPRTALEEHALGLASSGQMMQTRYGYAAPPEPMPPGAENAHPFPRDDVHPFPVTVVPQPYDCFTGLTEKGLNVLWRWSALDGAGVPLPESPEFNGTYQFAQSPDQRDTCARHWQICVWAYERQRIVGGPQTIAPATPELVPASHMSRLRIRVAWAGASGGTVRDIDVGEGIRLGVAACKVTISVIYQNPAVLSRDPSTLVTALQPGYYLDSEIGCSIIQATSTPGNQLTTLSQTVRVPLGVADVQVPVPAGTRRVSIYQTGAGSASVLEWRLFRGAIAASVGPSLGTLILGPARRLDRIDRPGMAGMITTGPADDEADRILTFVWDLEI